VPSEIAISSARARQVFVLLESRSRCFLLVVALE